MFLTVDRDFLYDFHINTNIKSIMVKLQDLASGLIFIPALKREFSSRQPNLPALTLPISEWISLVVLVPLPTTFTALLPTPIAPAAPTTKSNNK